VPSSELTHVCVSGLSRLSGAAGLLGAGLPVGVLLAAVLVVAAAPAGAAPAGALPVGALPVGALPAGRGGGVRIAASKRLNASLVSPARASAAPAN
jgi:hypothetical protein